ncbi:MAG: NUDIX hydrolase [Solirubrobacteraceae bacterium]
MSSNRRDKSVLSTRAERKAGASKSADRKQAQGGLKGSGKASGPLRAKQRGFGTKGPHEVSAGGVVVHEGKVLVIVPTRRAADGSLVLALPKGHLDGEETAEQAATREVREETGVQAEIVGELGEVRYWYVRDKRRVAKSVFFFLFRFTSGDLADHDDEVLEVRWMDFAEARKALSYPGERDMVDRAVALDGQDR